MCFKPKCCRNKRKQIAMKNARLALEKEIDIVQMIRSRRFVHAAIKHIIEPEVLKELKLRSKFKEVIMKKEPQLVEEACNKSS